MVDSAHIRGAVLYCCYAVTEPSEDDFTGRSMVSVACLPNFLDIDSAFTFSHRQPAVRLDRRERSEA